MKRKIKFSLIGTNVLDGHSKLSRNGSYSEFEHEYITKDYCGYFLCFLLLVVLSMGFMGCNRTIKEKLSDIDSLDPNKCTSVTIKGSYGDPAFAREKNDNLKLVRIYDSSDNLVGQGSLCGTYLVPYYGYIHIEWYSGDYKDKENVCSDDVSVGTLNKLCIVFRTLGSDYGNPCLPLEVTTNY